MKNRGFTDKLYFMNLLFTWLYTILCVVLTCLGGRIGIEDYSFVSIVTPLIWAELGVHTGYIISKAKAENLNKWKVGENANINVDI